MSNERFYPRIIETNTRMNGEGLKALALQISPISLVPCSNFQGSLWGYPIACAKNFNIFAHATGDPHKRPQKFECDTRCLRVLTELPQH